MDVGILRSDYLRFIEVIQDEIDKSGIKDVVAVFKISVQDRISPRFFQIEFRRPEFRGKFIGIDLFPYDFADNVDNIEEKFYESKAKFYKRLIDGMDIAEAVDMVYSELDLSFEKQEYLVPGVEGVRGKGEFYKLKVMKTDEVFPFKKVEFGGKTYNSPKDIDYYLKLIYGNDYMRILNHIHDHKRLNRYIKQPNIMNMLEESNDMIIGVNKKLGIE